WRTDAHFETLRPEQLTIWQREAQLERQRSPRAPGLGRTMAGPVPMPPGGIRFGMTPGAGRGGILGGATPLGAARMFGTTGSTAWATGPANVRAAAVTASAKKRSLQRG